MSANVFPLGKVFLSYLRLLLVLPVSSLQVLDRNQQTDRFIGRFAGCGPVPVNQFGIA
jgi:hypothetical protein